MRCVGRLAALGKPVLSGSSLRISSNSSVPRWARCAAGAAGPSAGPSPSQPSQGAPTKAARGAPGLIGANGLPLQSSSASGSNPAQGAEIEITAQNAAQILQSPAPILMQVGSPAEAVSKKLGRLRESAQGKLPLVKLDCRSLPQICQALQIKTEPAIFLMARGQVAAALETDLSPQAVTGFVEKCGQMLGLQVNLAEGASEQLAEAEEVEWQDADAAGEMFMAVNSAADLPQATRARVSAGLARCALRQGRSEEATAVIGELTGSDFSSTPEVKQAVALLELHKSREAATGDRALEELKTSMEADPTDAKLAEAYAVALFWNGDETGAMDVGLKLLRRKRSDEARKLVLMLLDALGPRHPRYAKARKSFSSALFA